MADSFTAMVPEDRFEIVERTREPEPRIVLRRRSGGGVVTIDAAALDAQYAISPSDTLLILDEDTPYEEQLHLVLLRDDQVLDHVVIGAPYASGVFCAEETHGDMLRFRFEDDAIWILTVGARGRRGFGGLPSGARRRGGMLAPQYIVLGRDDDGADG